MKRGGEGNCRRRELPVSGHAASLSPARSANFFRVHFAVYLLSDGCRMIVSLMERMTARKISDRGRARTPNALPIR
jgi:hypothetical protein